MTFLLRSLLPALTIFSGFALYSWESFSREFTSVQVWEQENLVFREYAGFARLADFPERICDVRDFGALPDSRTLSTEAINAAIKDCAVNGGGTVVIPAGRWNTGGIRLASHINLFLEAGAEVSFSTDVKEYLPVVLSRFQGIEFYNFAPLIYVRDAEHVAITGTGKLIGNGDVRTAWDGGGEFGSAREKLFTMALKGMPTEERIFGDRTPGLRPSFIQFVNCKNILLDGFTVENGPFWTIHPIYTDNFIARNLHIDTWSGNTDGIVIDSTTNTLIENSFFSTGDDAIVIKSGLDDDGWRVAKPSENVRIQNVHVAKGNSGVSIGSEMSGGVRNVRIENSVFENTRHGFRIKSTQTRGGFIEDVRVENITMNDVSSDVLTIDFAYNSALKTNVEKEPALRNIVMSNITGSGVGNSSADSIINIDGLLDAVMENIRFENIAFTSTASAVNLKSAKNISLKNIDIRATSDNPTYRIDHGRGIQIEHSACREGFKPCIRIEGKDSEDIRIGGIDFAKTPGAIETSTRVKKEGILVESRPLSLL